MAQSQSWPWLSYQPLRLIYTLTKVTTVLARVPLWIVFALVPPLRPHPKWTFKQSLLVPLTHTLVDMSSQIGITEKLSLEQGKEGDRFQVLEPHSKDLYQGPLASDRVLPAKIGGTWYPKLPEKPQELKTVLLHFHGGAFIMGDGRTTACGLSMYKVNIHLLMPTSHIPSIATNTPYSG
jgi:acetyl esterase/lipase